MMKIKEEPKVDLSDFPGMLQKLERSQEVIDSFVQTVNTLAEYIRKGFRMKPGESREFSTDDIDEILGRHVVEFHLSPKGKYSFRRFFRRGDQDSSFSSKVHADNPASDKTFACLLPYLVAQVRNDMRIEIEKIEAMEKAVRKSSLD
ncbi:MAG: hypothetical protein HGA67_01270 [Candidatus Yonathbacteria bacterium]|nr:hypothetical protein [Candidatus Yonathbacteria bacterium]